MYAVVTFRCQERGAGLGEGLVGVGVGPRVPIVQIPSERLMRCASEKREERPGCTDVWDSGETSLQIWWSAQGHRDMVCGQWRDEKHFGESSMQKWM